MEQQFHMTAESGNRKTGKIPVSTTCRSSCPPDCPYKDGKGCYGDAFPLRLHWDRLSQQQRNEHTFRMFVRQVSSLSTDQRWRHNQCGDLPGKGNRLAKSKCLELARAAAHTQGWTYTHKRLSPTNVAIIREMNQLGFTVNVSALSLAHLDKLPADLPAVVVLPWDFAGKMTKSPGGLPVLRCPATHEGSPMTCEACGGKDGPLCWRQQRGYAIGFPAHGPWARKMKI
jgi:hypothetical protein